VSFVVKKVAMLKIYNTLSRKTEEFQTLEPNLVKMYVCGVTVYNDAHVGHAMSALVFDIIRRYLEYRGYAVKHVMNYTDVDERSSTAPNNSTKTRSNFRSVTSRNMPTTSKA